MDWSSLFSMQKELDTYIEENHNLEAADLFQEKYLALLVELGELANETRCFKFWSNKPRSKNDKILEEYVDGIHFIMSLGIEKGLTYESHIIQEVPGSETEQFNKVFEACVLFKRKSDQHSFENLFNHYLLLGRLLGFDETDLQQAYFRKNKVNYERQNEGY